ncbi:MAG: hypothetical protein Q8Q37_02305 [bacterium]|nr:hypothetical protein [bacterium]
MKKIGFVVMMIMICLPFITGCTSTNHAITQTGLFDNDLDKMMLAYRQIEYGQTTKVDLENLGFDFEAVNVTHYSGPEAMREIFGDQMFNSVFNNAESDVVLEMDCMLIDFNRYEMYSVPYVDMVTKSDRFYFSEKKNSRKGVEVHLSLVLKDKTVVYAGDRRVRVDEKGADSAFAAGLFDAVGDVSGIRRAVGK